MFPYIGFEMIAALLTRHCSVEPTELPKPTLRPVSRQAPVPEKKSSPVRSPRMPFSLGHRAAPAVIMELLATWFF